MVESGRREELTGKWIKENLGIEIYAGGAENLEIKWIPEGKLFRIHEYDGSEYIILGEVLYIIA